MNTHPDLEIELARLQKLADFLDAAVTVPGTSIQIGIDGVIGLIPGIGDSITLPAGLWIVYRASRLGVPKRLLARMLFNVGVDYVFGLIPLLGDLFDIAWKANRRNVALVRTHFEKTTSL